MKKQFVIILITSLLIGISLSGCTSEEKKTMTYTELGKHVQTLGPSFFTLTSYKDGSILYIKDTIFNVSYVENESGVNYTFVMFEKFADSGNFPLCFNGDKRNTYKIGSTVTIPVHVKTYNIEGYQVIWLEEWYLAYIYASENTQPTEEITPQIVFLTNSTEKTLEVRSVSIADINWSDFRIINETGSYSPENFNQALIGAKVMVGDVLDFSNYIGAQTIQILYIPTGEIIIECNFT